MRPPASKPSSPAPSPSPVPEPDVEQEQNGEQEENGEREKEDFTTNPSITTTSTSEDQVKKSPTPSPAPQAGKPMIRRVWEITHYALGYSILLMSWYLCHSGLVKYSQLYQADDLSYVFWILTCISSLMIVVGLFQRFS